jgi:PAT family beta-lactamase induction signal transducer AmpG
VLDVRFSRRGYAAALAIFAAMTLVLAFLNLNHLALLEAMLTAGFFAAYLFQSALGGWLSSVVAEQDEKTLSVWMTIGNVGGFGVMAVGCNQLVSHVSPTAVALILGLSVLLPTAVFPWITAPGPDRRLASESFSEFFADLWKLVRRREVLIAIVLFVTPAGTFSLTNFLGGRGGDFHASPGFVGLIGGAGVAIGGVVGCLLFPVFSRLMALRSLYLTVGVVGALGTLALSLLPRTPASYAILLIGENLFQSFAITTSFAVVFETIGQNNPLASTTFCFISSAYGVPISYMLYVDAFGFSRRGITGSLLIDAVCGIVASLLLGMMLWLLARQKRRFTS